jgi:4-coumarate--CoA ligase
LLVTHPAVADAAVIGLPDEAAGELPLAYVVKKPGKTATEKELEKFIAENVSSQKRLRGGVIFVDEIPRNPSGKILRRHLKERAVQLKKSKL